ncbi:hypothetical protein ACTFIR_007543 [Dictyostelium discoideum]
MSTMLSSDSSNADVELIKIYGSEVLLPIKIKDTPKMFDETETERVRKLVSVSSNVFTVLTTVRKQCHDLLIVGSIKEECLSDLKKDNRLTCQTRFQVKSGKDCSRTNSINYVSRITNQFGINEAFCSKRKEEKCHQGNKKLLKTRLLLIEKDFWFKGKANRTERFSHPIRTLHSSNKQVSLSVPHSCQ